MRLTNMFRTLGALVAAMVGLPLAAVVLLIGLPFFMVAYLTKKVSGVFQKPRVSWKEVIEFNPTLGWKVKGNLDCHCDCGIITFHIQTDAQGYRSHVKLSDCDIVTFGDSYAFGYGVDNDKAYFSPTNTSVKIKPIGAPGYNMVQELLLMRQFSPYLQGKHIVWFICFGNDLYDNLFPNMEIYRAPFVRFVASKNDWEIVSDHVSPETWTYNFESNLREKEKWIGNFGTSAFTDRVYNASEYLLREGKAVCQTAGANLVVLTVPMAHQVRSLRAWNRKASTLGDPSMFDSGLPDRKFKELCSSLSIQYIPVNDYVSASDLIPVDGHWNERGHRQIAKILEALVDNRMSPAQDVVSPSMIREKKLRTLSPTHHRL